MTQNNDLPHENLARNLRFLMDRAGDKPKDLAKKTKGKVSQTAIHYILHKERIAKVDTVELIARVYGFSGWHLISPTFIEDLEQSPTLSKLLDDYRKADPAGKRHIEQTAEREARYVDKSST